MGDDSIDETTRGSLTSTMAVTADDVGAAVEVEKKGRGVLRWVGKAEFGGKKPSVYCGVELDESIGGKGGNGTVQGKQYFQCRKGHAVFTLRKRVALITDDETEVVIKGEPQAAGAAEALEPTGTLPTVAVAQESNARPRALTQIERLRAAKAAKKRQSLQPAVQPEHEPSDAAKSEAEPEPTPTVAVTAEPEVVVAEPEPAPAPAKMGLAGAEPEPAQAKAAETAHGPARTSVIKQDVGQRVIVEGKGEGVLRWMDKATFGKKKAAMYCGVELDVNLGAKGGNGTVQGAQYFVCDSGHGVFTSKKRVTLSEPVYAQKEVPAPQAPAIVVGGPQWQAALDPDSGDVYYVNLLNNEAQWEEPDGEVIPLDQGEMVTTFPKHAAAADNQEANNDASLAVPQQTISRESVAYYSKQLTDLDVPEGPWNDAEPQSTDIKRIVYLAQQQFFKTVKGGSAHLDQKKAKALNERSMLLLLLLLLLLSLLLALRVHVRHAIARSRWLGACCVCPLCVCAPRAAHPVKVARARSPHMSNSSTTRQHRLVPALAAFFTDAHLKTHTHTHNPHPLGVAAAEADS